MRGCWEVIWGQGLSSLTLDLSVEVKPQSRDVLYELVTNCRARLITLASIQYATLGWKYMQAVMQQCTGGAIGGGLCNSDINKKEKRQTLYSIKPPWWKLSALFFTLIPPFHLVSPKEYLQLFNLLWVKSEAMRISECVCVPLWGRWLPSWSALQDSPCSVEEITFARTGTYGFQRGSLMHACMCVGANKHTWMPNGESDCTEALEHSRYGKDIFLFQPWVGYFQEFRNPAALMLSNKKIERKKKQAVSLFCQWLLHSEDEKSMQKILTHAEIFFLQAFVVLMHA